MKRTAETDWCLHPGAHWEETLEHMEKTQAEAARDLNISAKHLNQIIKGKALPSVELTIAFARYSGIAPRFLWTLQSNFVLERAMGKKVL